MKKNTITSIFMILIFMGSIVNNASAQAHSQGQLGITGTIGYNLLSLVFSAVDRASDEFRSVPPITGAIDYGVSDRFSAGLAATYQSASFDIDENGEAIKANFTCVNIRVRPLFHFGNSDDLDFYAGVGVGTTLWNSSSESSNPDFDPISEFGLIGSRIKLQPLFGGTYFFNDGAIGLNGEIATGPHIVAIGVKARL